MPRLDGPKEPPHAVKQLLWAALIFCIAAYGAACVRNITTTLTDIAYHPEFAAADVPHR